MSIIKVIEIKGNTKEAQKAFIDLGKTIQEQKDITIEFEQELRDLEKQLKDTGKADWNPKGDLIRKKIVDIKDAIKDQKVSLKDLRNEQSKQNQVQELNLQSLTKNNGLITLLDKVTGGYASKVRQAVDASRAFNLSLKGMRTALIATGIGAFVVGLALVVAYWADIKDFVEGTTRALEKQQKGYDRLNAKIDHELELNKLNQEILFKQGKSTTDLVNLEAKLLLKKQETIDKSLINLKAQLEIENSKTREVTLLEKGLIALKGYVFGYSSIASDVASAQGLDIVSALQGQINDLETKALKVESALLGDPEKPEDTKTPKEKAIEEVIDPVEAEQERLRKIQELQDFYFIKGLEREIAEIERKAEADIAELVALDAHKSLIEDVEQASQDRIDKLVKTASDKKVKENDKVAEVESKNDIKWADLTASAKLGIASSVLAGVADLVDKNSVAGKGIAVAQTGINTAQGIMQAFATLPTVAAIAAAAVVGLTGTLKTKEILTKKIPSATGKGFVSGGAGGGASPTAPAFNLVEGTADNQINDSINLGNQEPVQAYVVSGDVTTAQNLDNNIITESGL